MPCELQHLSPKLLIFSKITEEIPARNGAALPKRYSASSCHGQPGLLAAGCYFARESQPVQQGNCWELNCEMTSFACEEYALWLRFQLHMRGVPGLLDCTGVCEEMQVQRAVCAQQL